ncbi:MAG: MBOAT family O-acyltransferase [Pseudomonadota bacterium]
MTSLELLFLSAGLASVALSWVLPGRAGEAAVMLVAGAALLVVAPLSLGWLLGGSFLVLLAIWMGERIVRRDLVVLCVAPVLVAAFLATRFENVFLWIGGAYFTLRLLHVLFEWQGERIAAPSLWQMLRYQFFAPVLLAGPIHRFQNFEREIARRRWDAGRFYLGLERLLLGLFAYAVIAGPLFDRFRILFVDRPEFGDGFLAAWVAHAAFWVWLYISFEGLSAIAIGLALMMGLRIEENFNRPWAARHLADFWTRWHMTLTHWCRDYVFRPVAARTRLPALAAIASLLTIGIWHDVSAYFVLWGLWQGIGVSATQYLLRHPVRGVPGPVTAVAGRLSVILWLSLTAPVITELLGVSP